MCQCMIIQCFFNRLAHNWNDLGWLVVQTMGEMFVESDEVGNVDVAEVLP